MNTPNNPTSLRTQENQDIMEEWRGKTDRPKWVDLLAFKILEELIYEDARLKIGLSPVPCGFTSERVKG